MQWRDCGHAELISALDRSSGTKCAHSGRGGVVHTASRHARQVIDTGYWAVQFEVSPLVVEGSLSSELVE